MPGPTTSQSTSVTKTELPAWINNAAQENWNLAKSITPKVADLSPTTTQAFNLFKDNLGAGSADLDAASDVFSRMSNPNSFAADIPGYLNPYIDQVETKALGALEDQRQRTLMGNADAATKARAFGGSRSAVIDAITNSESAKDAGLLSSQLRQQGYSDAVSNRRADLTTAGQGYLSTANQKQASLLKDFQTLSSIGAQEQAQEQKKLNGPLDNLNMRLAALGMMPYESSSTTNSSGTPGSPGFDWGTGILGGISLLAGLL